MLKLSQKLVGAPLTNDADPNATEPSPKRVFQTPMRDGYVGGGTWRAVFLLQDGTSVDVSVWIKARELGDSWHVLNTTAVTVTALEAGILEGIPPEAEVFIQLTSVTGAPTNFGVALD